MIGNLVGTVYADCRYILLSEAVPGQTLDLDPRFFDDEDEDYLIYREYATNWYLCPEVPAETHEVDGIEWVTLVDENFGGTFTVRNTYVRVEAEEE